MSPRRLIIVLGPTAVGKTQWSLSLAKKYSSPVISCDSRQFYREMSIGTAVPSEQQLSQVKHYFIQDRSVCDGTYTAGMYELEAVSLVERLFGEGHDTLVMCGGSPFYIDAVCGGLDNFPASDPQLRESLLEKLRSEGLATLVKRLEELDPETARTIDTANHQRVVRALEVCLMTGRPFSSFKTGCTEGGVHFATVKKRSFEIEKIGLIRPREALYARIDARAEQMFRSGLVEEVRSLEKWRNLPALQTVGYREVFPCLDGEYDLARALELVQRNTRRYAKRQLSWWRRDSSIRWMDAESLQISGD